MPWGILSLVDLYTGFTLVSMLIAYRGYSLPVAVLAIGFFAGVLHAFTVLQASNGDWRRFCLEKNA